MTGVLAARLGDLAAYSLQAGVVLAVGLLLGRACLGPPRWRLAWAQLVLLIALVLPVAALFRPPADSYLVALGAVAGGPGRAADQPLWPMAVALVIACGAAVRLVVLARRVHRLRLCRRAARPWTDGAALAAARTLAGGSAAVYVCDALEIPATYGARRPVVLVPVRFLSLPAAAQTAVLCHEMRHARRQDWLQMLAEELVCALLWFHPAFWWAVREIREAREQAVDREVVRLTGERRVYLHTLLRLAGGPAGTRPAPAALLLSESRLAARIESLLKEVTMTKKAFWSGLGASVGGVALATAMATWAFPLGTPAAPAKRAAERKVLHKPNAAYPAEAKERGIEGDVVMDVRITAAGDVEDVKVTKGPADLREAAAEAVRQWKYAPSDRDVRATLTIRFVLDKKKTSTDPKPARGAND
ncbi:MAG TPA: M56 family metallopeptidase [Vicinamibacteria bacterium]